MAESGYDVKYEVKGQSFIWNSVKYDINISKHKIAFEEAATVFTDNKTEYYEDKTHSVGENRFIALGMSNKFRMLMVCHCLRENENVIRIISARKAGKTERKQFRSEY